LRKTRQASNAPGQRSGDIQQGQEPARDVLSCDHFILAFSGARRASREFMASGEETGTRQGPSDRGEARRRVGLLYRDHAPRLRRRLRAELKSSEDASDILHEAFARLLGADGLDRVLQPEAFLNRILRNLLIDRSRRLATRAIHVGIDDEPAIGVPPDQSQAIEAEQMRQRYRDVVASLPERMREVFLLHRVEQLSYKQIAERLGISVRTVEWHIAEAIVRIGKGLDAE
jgi:RNA polymerase sigma factor (sigma-70 family)